MFSGEIILFGTPVVAALLAGALAYGLGRIRQGTGTIMLAGVIGVFTLWMFTGLQTISGWDALIYLLGLIGIALPAAFGGIVGGLIGWNQKDDPKHA